MCQGFAPWFSAVAVGYVCRVKLLCIGLMQCAFLYIPESTLDCCLHIYDECFTQSVPQVTLPPFVPAACKLDTSSSFVSAVAVNDADDVEIYSMI